MEVVFALLAILAAVALYAYITRRPAPGRRRNEFGTIADRFASLNEVTLALRRKGLESSNLIIGIDFTKSNNWTGAETFGGRSLHTIDPKGVELNPYQEAISIIGRTLADFDDDGLIPVLGFGDMHTTDASVFSLNQGLPCRGLNEALDCYRRAAGGVVMSGPTSFVPLIDHAIQIVRETGQYHILLIIADGQVTNVDANVRAIVRASSFPLSIVMVGVGDGPWDVMEEFDDLIPQRRFDNFQFVNFHRTMATHRPRGERQAESAFALNALMEIPDQYDAIRRLGLLSRQQ